MSVLGLGYTGPYLQLWREQAVRCIAVSPQQMGLASWPLGRASLACLSEEDALPFPDLSSTASCWCTASSRPTTPAACCVKPGAC